VDVFVAETGQPKNFTKRGEKEKPENGILSHPHSFPARSRKLSRLCKKRAKTAQKRDVPSPASSTPRLKLPAQKSTGNVRATMHKRAFLNSILTGVAALFLGACAQSPKTNETASENWRPLLDEKLSLWEPFLGVPAPEIKVPGYTYKKNTPVGLRDPNGVYTVQLVDGEPVLHVSGEVFGGLTTKETFADYHVRFEFRWGQKKYAPRKNAKKRDGGFVFHAIGEHGFFANAWKHAAQFQIQETDVGDFFPLFENKAFKADVPAEGRRYTPGAPFRTLSGGITKGAAARENAHGDWNSCELLAVGADAVLVLNGKVVNVVKNMRYVDVKSGSSTEKPLTSGQFQIQSEGAEMDFRRIEIKPIAKFPAAYADALAGK
jgi:hypothetical protein